VFDACAQMDGVSVSVTLHLEHVRLPPPISLVDILSSTC
jgi:hypothetical protein